MHNYQLVNQLQFNPHKEQIDHQKYIKALSESQDLVQESMQDKSSQEEMKKEAADNKATEKDTDVESAMKTVRTILAQQGVPIGSDSSPQSIEQLLQQAQMVDQSLKNKKME